MIVDEAHCLKNQNGARYKNMDNVNTQRRLLLTGTPVQNRPAELVSLLCFLMPVFADAGSRGSAESDDNSKDCAMIEYFRSLESNAKGGKSNTDSTSMIQQLKQLLAPFILRRKKDDVMSQLIPPKTKKVEFVPFDQCGQQIYEGILTSHINSKSKGGVTNIEDLTFQKHLFTSLRKAANHPLLLRTRFTAAAEIAHLSKHLHLYGYFGYHETCTVQLVEKELENYSDYDIHCAALTLIEQKPLRREELGRYILDDDTLFLSPKFQRLKVR
jgi:SWI/SNF-related matrix-associated actin-dependent regulator 1 of chromatin subfamily A